jgi:HlyD family secretion protein
MKRKRIIAIIGTVALVSILSYRFLINRPADISNKILVSGNVEVTDARVSFKIPGRMIARNVSEGDVVRKGQLIAQLDVSELQQEESLRRAEMEAAEAALAELEAGSRPEEIAQAEAAMHQTQARLKELLAGSRIQEIAAAEASVMRAKAEMKRSDAEYERQAKLYRKEVISEREYEAAQAAHAAAKTLLREAEERFKLVREGPRREEIDQAQARLVESQERLTLVRKGPRRETIEQARARVQQAMEALNLARTRLGYSTLTSPLGGMVLSENIEAGEYVSPGTPVVTVGRLDKVWIRAYIDETDLGRVRIGQPVSVTTDTYPGKIYKGRVSFLSSEAEFTPKNVQTQKERVKLVYRIKIDVENSNMELKPGMPADAEISLSADS